MDKRNPTRKHHDDNPEQSHPFLYEQLCKLSKSLGKPKHNVRDSIKYILRKHSFDNEKRYELVVLNNLRLRFEKMQRIGDSRNNDINELRANLCMHLYRELVRVESDEDKRYQYLKLFYELFDAAEPDNMTESETLNYRLVVIDSLNNQVNNLLSRIETMEVNQSKSEDSVKRSVQSKLNVEIYAKKELFLHKHCELKGFSYQHGSLVWSNLNKNIFNTIETTNNKLKNQTKKCTSDDGKLSSIESKINANLKTFSISKPEQHKTTDLKELAVNSKRTTEKEFSNQPQDKLKIFNNFESRIPRLQRLESSPARNTFLSKEFKKYKVHREILNLCQSENFFKPKPKGNEITIIGYCYKENISTKYGSLKGFVYQYGYLIYVEPKNKTQDQVIKTFKSCLPTLQSLKPVKKLKEFQLKAIENVGKLEYYAVLEHSSSKCCKTKGLLCHLESLKWADAESNNHIIEQKENDSIFNDIILLEEIIKSKIYDFSIERTGEDCKRTISKDELSSSPLSSNSTIKQEKQNVIDNIDIPVSRKLSAEVLEQELENYKDLLVKLQESQASLSKIQNDPKKMDNLANSSNVSLDLTRNLQTEKVLLDPSSSAIINEKKKVVQLKKSKELRAGVSYAAQVEVGGKFLKNALSRLDNAERQLLNSESSSSSSENQDYRKFLDKKKASGEHTKIQESYITIETNPILYKSNIVNHFIHPPCQMKGFKLNSGSLEWADVEEKNHEYIMAQFMEMDDVVADVQKALNQIIENNFHMKESTAQDFHNSGSKDLPNNEAPNKFLNVESITSLSKTKLLDKGLENYKLLLDELKDVRLDSNRNIKEIVMKYQVKGQSFNHLTDCLTESKTNAEDAESSTSDNNSAVTARSICRYKSENSIDEEDNCKDCCKKNESLKKWQHQRHILAEPGSIVHLFRTNPAYQCSSINSNSPNLFEELEQLNELVAQKDNPLTKLIDVSAVYKRLKLIMDRVGNQLPENISYKDWFNLVGKIQIKHVLTQKERVALEAMRRQLIDRSNLELSDEECLRDAFNGMLGYECQQLRYSFGSTQLLLRSPEHQRNLSGSYLLLLLGHLGYIYRSLQNQQAGLKNLGKSGLALARTQRMELLLYKEFHIKIQNCEKAANLYHIWKFAKLYQYRFQWMVNLNGRILKQRNVFSPLLKEQRGCNNKLLQKWLLLASQPMLEKLSRWLRHGELTDSENAEFFITENLSVTTEKFWHERFRLLPEYIPQYFSKELCQSLLTVGKYHRYGKEFLGIDVDISLNYQEFINAFQLIYQKCNFRPLNDLIRRLHEEISFNILFHIEPPIYIFYKLFKYVLLRDLHFATKLIDYLEPVLEQSANLFDLEQFNYMLEQLLTEDNTQLYIEEVPSDGTLCWSRFKLNWHWSHNWQALLGKSIDIYSSIFTDIWKFQYASYVLCERLSRQQKHFSLRIKLEFFEDVNQVQQIFQVLIDIFVDIMSILRNYICIDVLDAAYSKLKPKCHKIKTLDDVVEAHNQYLKDIVMDLFQTKRGSGCMFYLNQLYSYIHELDAIQQKFILECQSMMVYLKSYPNSDDISNRLLNFNCSCKDKWNTLNVLGDNFQLCLSELMLKLSNYGSKKSKLLAEKLYANDLPKIPTETLQNH